MENKCNTCKFWTRNKIGNCSQKMLTQDGVFVNVQTFSDYGCNTYEHDIKKMDVRLWEDEKGIHHSGTTSKEYIESVIKYLQNLKGNDK